MDPRSAPTDIRRLHLSDELAYFFIYGRQATRAGASPTI